MEYIVFMIVALLIATTSTLSFYFLCAKHSKKYYLHEEADHLLWLVLLLSLADGLRSDVLDKDDAGLGWWILTIAVAGVISGTIRMLVVKCAKALWHADEAQQAVLVKPGNKVLKILYSLFIIIEIGMAIFFAIATYNLLPNETGLAIATIFLIFIFLSAAYSHVKTIRTLGK